MSLRILKWHSMFMYTSYVKLIFDINANATYIALSKLFGHNIYTTNIVYCTTNEHG